LLIELFANDSVLMGVMKNNDKSVNKFIKKGIQKRANLEIIEDSIRFYITKNKRIWW